MTETVSDVRFKKRQMRSARKVLLQRIEAELSSRRCFWTWPFGHNWGGNGVSITTRSTDSDRVSRCEHCGRPYSWESFDLYDLLSFAEKEAEIPEDDPDLQRIWELWRAS